MTIADSLMSLIDTKEAIKTSITNKGVDLTGVPFTEYPVAIDSITTSSVEQWDRHSDWLPMPTVLATEQKIVALYAVFNHEANDICFFTQGACTVDWGDGVIENFASNAKANHLYNYSNISDTTLSSRGYKQVIVTVTPQAGQNLTSVNLAQAHPITNKVPNSYLEMKMSLPKCYSLEIGGGYKFAMVENIDIISIGNITSLMTMFQWMSSLQRISYFNTANVTNLLVAFQGCYSLKEMPDFNFSSVTNTQSAFDGCRLIQKIPNTFGALSGNSHLMFKGCSSLKEIPSLNTSAVTNMSNMFGGCSSLKEIPSLNTSAVTNMSNMFDGCSSLRAIPTLNTSNVTNTSYMFRGCRSLTTIPLMDFSKVTTVESMFQECSSLKAIPDFNFSSLINNQWFSSGLFDSCHSLTKVGNLVFTKLTSIGPMFKDCHSLQEIGNIDFSAVTDTNLSNAFNAAQSLAKCGISGLKQTFSIANGSLPATELNRIFTNLPTVATSKTITVTGNPGAATCDTTIATAKNWVVVK